MKMTEEKKERLRGFFWEGGGRSGFVGRLTESRRPEPEDERRARSLASTWAAVARLRGGVAP